MFIIRVGVSAVVFCLMACGRVGFDEAFFISSRDGGSIGGGQCDDHKLNNGEPQIDCGGPNCKACLVGVATSCKALHAAQPTLTSDVYTIDVDDVGPQPGFKTYCEMGADGGGWTLAMKIDGTKTTFDYENLIWVSEDTYNESATALDDTEAKLASFSTLAALTLRVGMKRNGVTQWLVIPVNVSPAKTLQALFGGESYVATSVGKPAWLGLVSGSGLQAFCNKEGFNVRSSVLASTKVRLGILSNENGVNDCASCDSFVGFGTGNPRSDNNQSNTTFLAGTGNGWGGDNNNGGTLQLDLPAMGYIMVRE